MFFYICEWPGSSHHVIIQISFHHSALTQSEPPVTSVADSCHVVVLNIRNILSHIIRTWQIHNLPAHGEECSGRGVNNNVETCQQRWGHMSMQGRVCGNFHEKSVKLSTPIPSSVFPLATSRCFTKPPLSIFISSI